MQITVHFSWQPKYIPVPSLLSASAVDHLKVFVSSQISSLKHSTEVFLSTWKCIFFPSVSRSEYSLFFFMQVYSDVFPFVCLEQGLYTQNCSWVCKMIYQLWKTTRYYLKRLKMSIHPSTNIPFLVKYLTEPHDDRCETSKRIIGATCNFF